MTNWSQLPLYLVVSLIGGFGGYKLKIPAGTLIGAMVAVIAYKLIVKSDWEIPKHFSFLIQVLLGLMVGASFNVSLLPVLQKILLPVFLSSVILVATGILIAFIFAKTGLLDIETGYLGTSPGAMSILIVLALDSHVNAAVVTCFHLFRLIFVIFTAPLILRFLSIYKNL